VNAISMWSAPRSRDRHHRHAQRPWHRTAAARITRRVGGLRPVARGCRWAVVNRLPTRGSGPLRPGGTSSMIAGGCITDDDAPVWRWCASDQCAEPGRPAAPAAGPLGPNITPGILLDLLGVQHLAEGSNRSKWAAEGDCRKLCGLV